MRRCTPKQTIADVQGEPRCVSTRIASRCKSEEGRFQAKPRSHEGTEERMEQKHVWGRSSLSFPPVSSRENEVIRLLTQRGSPRRREATAIDASFQFRQFDQRSRRMADHGF
jgi:hypothetical protein